MLRPRSPAESDRHSIAVIGAGIIGLATAYELAHQGWPVAVFERGQAAQEASWAGAGMLAPGGEALDDPDFARMAVESRRLYPGFVARLAADSELAIDFQTNGGLELAYSSAERDAIEARAEQQRAWSIPSKSISAAHLTQFWPHLTRDGLAGGRFYPEDAAVDPRHITAALKRALLRLQVPLLEYQPVDAITPGSGGSCPDGIVLNLTDSPPRHFAAAILATGAWSNLIRVGGHPLPAVEPVKGILAGYLQPEGTCGTLVRYGHLYLLQRSSGLLIVGATTEHSGFARDIDPVSLGSLLSEAASVMPHLGETAPTVVWTGLRPYAAKPVIGQWGDTPLYLAYGHYRNGILLAPWTAREIARQISANLGTP